MTLPDRRLPIDGGRIAHAPSTRAWGAVRETHVHAGVDIGARPGTPVLAPEAGVVESVGRLPQRPPFTGYAPAVLLRGASGRWHLLAHLSGTPNGMDAAEGWAPLVQAGDTVELAHVLGYVGHERHVHWEVRTRPHARRLRGETTYTITIDPERWLEGEETALPPKGAPTDPRRPPHRQLNPCQVLSRSEWARVAAAREWCSYSSEPF